MAVFDAIANDYDSWYDTKIGSFADKVETHLALSMFSPYKGMEVLDVGCGTGNFSIKLARLGCRVTGIDLSQSMLDIAREKAGREKLDIAFYNMDVYSMEFPDEYFDGVFSMAAFEFIGDPLKAYKEMYRVVKPGGKILIGTINRDSSWGRLYMSEEYQRNSIFKYARFMTLEELKSLDRENLKDAGECLFISPFEEDQNINIEMEEKLSRVNRGGFICALWEKRE